MNLSYLIMQFYTCFLAGNYNTTEIPKVVTQIKNTTYLFSTAFYDLTHGKNFKKPIIKTQTTTKFKSPITYRGGALEFKLLILQNCLVCGY